MRSRLPFTFCGLVVAASLAACGGGGGSTGGGGGFNPPPVIPTPTPTATPVSTQQVVTMALPSSAMGSLADPTFGAVGGYTQALYSQTLAFAPGSQIMVRNGQAAAIPHTLNVVSTSAASGFVASPNPPLSTGAAGGSTIGAGFSSGTIAAGALAGPFTLAAGTYWLGCAYHYASDTMRTVLVVAAGATPGPQATPSATKTAPPPGGGGY